MRDDNSELGVMPDFGCRVSGPLAGYKDGTPKTECEGFGSGTINMDLFSELAICLHSGGVKCL